MLRSETSGDPKRMARALKGLRAYQEAPRADPMPLAPAIDEKENAVLRDYGGAGRTVLFVPSLINPPNILDLSEDKSLLRWLAGRGHRVVLLDWGWDSEGRRDMSVGDHVELILAPLVETLEEPPALVGYCLGGTMAVAAASLTPVRSLATIAAPWHFSGFPEASRESLSALWESSRQTVEGLGLLPMEILQSAFWSLDPARTVAKFEAFAAMDPGGAEAGSFVTMEDWANDGPPLGKAAARELFEDFFAADLPGSGGWIVGGKAIDPAELECPLLDIVSTTDRIVPGQSSVATGKRVELDQGHVGMVAGSRTKAGLWKLLDDWLR